MKTRFLLSIAFLLSGLLANAQDSDFITLQRDTVYVSGRGYIKRLRYKKVLRKDLCIMRSCRIVCVPSMMVWTGIS